MSPEPSLPKTGDWEDFGSARAGYSSNKARLPTYRIIRSAVPILEGWKDKDQSEALSLRRGLTNWIVSQHLAGVQKPVITSAIIQKIVHKKLSFNVRKERFFRFVADRGYDDVEDFRLEDEPEQLFALLDMLDNDQLISFAVLLCESGLLKGKKGYCSLTPKGFEVLDNNSFDSTSVFVAMWFDAKTDLAFEAGIGPAIKKCGLEAIRIDKKDHANKICDEIISEIRRARFVVADFTCGLTNDEKDPIAIARGGVYYEAGFAQGLGKTVIWTCKAEQIKHVHFDTRQYAHILWDNPADLATKLESRIKALGLSL